MASYAIPWRVVAMPWYAMDGSMATPRHAAKNSNSAHPWNLLLIGSRGNTARTIYRTRVMLFLDPGCGRQASIALQPAGCSTPPALLMCCSLSVVSGLRTFTDFEPFTFTFELN